MGGEGVENFLSFFSKKVSFQIAMMRGEGGVEKVAKSFVPRTNDLTAKALIKLFLSRFDIYEL